MISKIMAQKRFEKWRAPKIKEGQMTKWNWVVVGLKNFKLGKNTDIGAFCYINSKDGVEIEDNVQIGGGVKIYSQDTIGNNYGKVLLRKNCKVGANSVVLPNVEIGENSIIGACSFVKSGTKIPANEIWAGRPAVKIK